MRGRKIVKARNERQERAGSRYLHQEREEIVELFLKGLTKSAVVREFHRRHPNRPPPNKTFVRRLYKKYLKTGSVKLEKPQGRPPDPIKRELKEATLKFARENPHLTNFAISNQLGVSPYAVRNWMSQAGFRRDKRVIVLRATEEELASRLTYCNWFLDRLAQTPTFADDILFADEAVFHLHGKVNHHNILQHASAKTQLIVDGHHQYNVKLVVWCGIHNRKVIGPYFFQSTFNGQNYLRCLSEVLQPYLDSLSPYVRDRMYYQQDNALPHRAKIVTQWLDKQFEGRWIGWGSNLPWPSRAFDLTPVNFFLWDYLQSAAFTPTPTSLDQLKENIRSACLAIDSAKMASVSEDIVQRVRTCLSTSDKQNSPVAIPTVPDSDHLKPCP